MKALEFNFKPQSGDAEDGLTRLIGGSEVRPNDLKAIQSLMWELTELVTNAKGMGDSDFLSLKSTVHKIVEKRFSNPM